MSLGRLSWIALVAGLTGAVVEMVFVLPIQQFALGHSPRLVFQSIAMGALGMGAFTEGLRSALIGVAVHVLVSVVAAGVYVFAATRQSVLIRRPAAGGVVFGALVYVFMTFGVIPLSAIGFHPPKSFVLFLASFLIHLFAFGLPIALVAGAMMRSRTRTP
jgi:hypothetical protein